MWKLRKRLDRLLDNPASDKITISAVPPFIKITFDTAHLRALRQAPEQVSEVVAKYFNQRRVFWEDLQKEHHEYVLQSLAEVKEELNTLSGQLSSQTHIPVALTRSVRHWATSVTLVHKELRDQLGCIADEKASVPGYDSAGEDRTTVVSKTLISLRQHIYPLIHILIHFLDDNDPTKVAAKTYWEKGLGHIRDASQMLGCIPDVDEADEN